MKALSTLAEPEQVHNRCLSLIIQYYYTIIRAGRCQNSAVTHFMTGTRKDSPRNPFFSLLFVFLPHLLPSLTPFQPPPPHLWYVINPLWSSLEREILDPQPRNSLGLEKGSGIWTHKQGRASDKLAVGGAGTATCWELCNKSLGGGRRLLCSICCIYAHHGLISCPCCTKLNAELTKVVQ